MTSCAATGGSGPGGDAGRPLGAESRPAQRALPLGVEPEAVDLGVHEAGEHTRAGSPALARRQELASMVPESQKRWR